jgi:hypothetical protein
MQMATTTFEIYRSRGEQLSNAMLLCFDGIGSYTAAVALLAVHSAISYNDALLVLLTEKRPKGENHQEAVKLAKTACRQLKLDSTGVMQLEKLLRAKADVSYGSSEVHTEKAKVLFYAAQRFQAWVEKRFSEQKPRIGQ